MTSTNDGENRVSDRSMKKDLYYVSTSNGPHQIITQVQLINKNSTQNYDEWAKAIRMAPRSKRKLRVLDRLISNL